MNREAYAHQTSHSFSSFFLNCIFLATPCHIQGLSFPNQELIPHPLQWKHGVLTTELSGKSFRLISLGCQCLHQLLWKTEAFSWPKDIQHFLHEEKLEAHV